LKLKADFPTVRVLRNSENLSVAEGLNIGIRYAVENGYDFALPFDNDAPQNNPSGLGYGSCRLSSRPTPIMLDRIKDING
jgi:glycosyltransferase involved in cell wall biosynthesis